MLSQVCGMTSQALQWWQERQQQRELKQLYAREFAGYQ
jgi:hypothetical protein